MIRVMSCIHDIVKRGEKEGVHVHDRPSRLRQARTPQRRRGTCALPELHTLCSVRAGPGRAGHRLIEIGYDVVYNVMSYVAHIKIRSPST